MNLSKRTTGNSVPGWSFIVYPWVLPGLTKPDCIISLESKEYLLSSADIRIQFRESINFGGQKRNSLSGDNVLYLDRDWAYSMKPGTYQCTKIGPDHGPLNSGEENGIGTPDVAGYDAKGYYPGSRYAMVVALNGERFYLVISWVLVKFSISFIDPSGRAMHWSENEFWGFLKRADVEEYVERHNSGCAITTAVTTVGPKRFRGDLAVLRSYRREWLDSFVMGRWLSSWYDRWSPPVAIWLAASPHIARFLLCLWIHPSAYALTFASRHPVIIRTIVRVGVLGWYVTFSLAAIMSHKLCRLMCLA